MRGRNAACYTWRLMTFGFLNLLMLGGLAGVALPVVVHLISRRKYDVVSWGAMQFLEVGRRTRRRIRLEELLLLLLRIGLICLLALALARPWAKGGWFSKLSRSTPRDVAVVIDGSYSMGWEGDAVTPHAAAIQRTFELLEELAGGDTVTLLDARDKVRPLIERLTTDFRLVREQLDALPSPSGTSSVVSALTKAAQLLTSGEHLDHDIILMTDAQRLSWSPEDERSWRRFDETISQSSIPSHVWVVDVGMQQTDTPTNFSVDRLRLSRDL
ncbi:MAG: BatA domain-containing protein, partial [Planctomycetaceae bacterium]|nr:BatA domain-containing protein [Planctomycetaceae bacterium]